MKKSTPWSVRSSTAHVPGTRFRSRLAPGMPVYADLGNQLVIGVLEAVEGQRARVRTDDGFEQIVLSDVYRL